MNNVIINNKAINLKPINFEALCELEELGFDVTSVSKKAFSSIRCAVAYQMGISNSEASLEIEEHIKNGGKIADFSPFIEAITNSDFFQSMTSDNKE